VLKLYVGETDSKPLSASLAQSTGVATATETIRKRGADPTNHAKPPPRETPTKKAHKACRRKP